MDKKEVLERVKLYNKNVSFMKCSALEYNYVAAINRDEYFGGFGYLKCKMYDDVEMFLERNQFFRNLLKDNHQKICDYLRHIQEYTCHDQLVRMDVRSSDFSRYQTKVTQAIGSFYIFYAGGLNMKDLIYGQYRQLFNYQDFAPVIAVELLNNNQEVVKYCEDVLLSENNTAVLTRDVIKAIQQSHCQKLQDLLMKVFLAAKLQEGLRQAFIETVDENQLDYFIKTIDVIKQEKLLRFSSIKRGIMTWIGIGYELAEDQQIQMIFDCLYTYLHDETLRKQALYDQNPLCIYIALYCLGMRDVDLAIQEAIELLESGQRHIVACALVYLKLTRCFVIEKYFDYFWKYKDDEWILALCLDELSGKKMKGFSFSNERACLMFDFLIHFVKHMKFQQTYTSRGFEWFHVSLYKPMIVKWLFEIMDCYKEDCMIEQLLPYTASCLYDDELKKYMKKYFDRLPLQLRKDFMLKEIISSNKTLAECIVGKYKQMDLDEKDIQELEERLKTKKEYSRAYIVQVIASQKKEYVVSSYQRLMASSSKTIQDSAKELRLKVPKYFDEPLEKIIIKGKDEGFGLYDPYFIYTLPYKTHLKYIEKGFIRKKKIIDLSFMKVFTKQETLDYIQKWNDRILKHLDDEYEVRGEYYQLRHQYFSPIDFGKCNLDALPLADVWRKYFDEDKLSSDELFFLQVMNKSIEIFYTRLFSSDIDLYNVEMREVESFKYFDHYYKIMDYYFMEFKDNIKYRENACALLEILNHYCRVKEYKKREFGETKIYSVSSTMLFSFIMKVLDLENVSDEEFKNYFPSVYESYVEFHLKLKPQTEYKFKIAPLVLTRAVLLGLIPQTALFESLLDNHTRRIGYNKKVYEENCLYEGYRDAYFQGKGIYGNPIIELPKKHSDVYRLLRESLDKITETLIPMEMTRYNEKTEITHLVQHLYVIRGMKYLIMALRVLEGEDIKRQTYGDEKVIVFGNIIRNCYPLESDSAEMLKKENFLEKRLVEVAMMAPQWIDIIAEVLGWEGFKETCYYFIAHMKQYEKDQKKAEIAHYTDLDPDDLNDGAFDNEWCQKVNRMMGEKHMKIVYQSAKFLCENSFHTRARKYADACLGKVSREEYLKQAKEKRNKDALNAYCICPLIDDQDLLARYTYVQQFLKESKKFGAQRQASEKRACEIALMNLARNSRFETVTRLSWMMESEMIKQNAYAFKPTVIGDIEVWIEIDEQGKNEIKVRKNGKKLKSIPSQFKNNEKIIELKNIHTMLNEQYRRSRHMLESAMEERVNFTLEEIETIMKNPVVSPMLSKLVLYSGGNFGYYDKGKLKGIDDIAQFDGQVKIAHPYDLYEHQIWHAYQKDIFNKQIVQPFKQVFRELYTKLDDELEHSFTKRYTGYQIQPKKAAGALKSRRWNVSYENGLERVCYKENMIVNLYADADWFSPSDIEAPSIDYVSFVSRNDNKPILIKDIDDVVFSETMRDVDLAVSTAYVGGVDPLTTFSTMELRKTIVEYTCELMKLDNVSVQDHFVNIHGAHNDYSVHLGSGMIHQTGGGMIHVVPIYSGKRGKVYLPFLDEDPMTAQIVTKVIMFAEDTKIKDPAILKQIISLK